MIIGTNCVKLREHTEVLERPVVTNIQMHPMLILCLAFLKYEDVSTAYLSLSASIIWTVEFTWKIKISVTDKRKVKLERSSNPSVLKLQVTELIDVIDRNW